MIPLRFVHKPNPYSEPGFCILLPGRRNDDRGFIDAGMTLDGIRGDLNVYISAEGVRQAAQRFPQLGLVDDERLRVAEAERDELASEVDRLTHVVADFEAKFERINGLQKDGFKVVRQQGRPPKKAD